VARTRPCSPDASARRALRGDPAAGGSPAVDASVRAVVLCWPVIDPLGRYRYAKKLKESGQPYPEVVDRVLPGHDQYWKTEDAMAEGSPVIALERGRACRDAAGDLLAGPDDKAHPRADLDRFVTQYRKARRPGRAGAVSG